MALRKVASLVLIYVKDEKGKLVTDCHSIFG
jgi:hypothetical protein